MGFLKKDFHDIGQQSLCFDINRAGPHHWTVETSGGQCISCILRIRSKFIICYNFFGSENSSVFRIQFVVVRYTRPKYMPFYITPIHLNLYANEPEYSFLPSHLFLTDFLPLCFPRLFYCSSFLSHEFEASPLIFRGIQDKSTRNLHLISFFSTLPTTLSLLFSLLPLIYSESNRNNLCYHKGSHYVVIRCEIRISSRPLEVCRTTAFRINIFVRYPFEKSFNLLFLSDFLPLPHRFTPPVLPTHPFL